MSINEYAETARKNSKGKIKTAIAERWNTRVIPRGLHTQGRWGAQAYLESYGKNIAAPKVVELALCAESMQAPAMAAGFWEAAYQLETGTSASFAIEDSIEHSSPHSNHSNPVHVGKTKEKVILSGLPSDLQPGSVAPMQPKDAQEPESHYILNSSYQAQPKRDGQKNFLFGTEEETAHQSRSTSIMGMLAPEFEAAVQAAARELGDFVLEGERYYRSASGSEHRTAAQAATANIEMEQGNIPPIPVYGAFRALFAQGRDLRQSTEDGRVAALTPIVALIQSHLPSHIQIEAVPTATTPQEKQALLNKQKTEGREGVVWTRRDCSYTPGDHTEITCRTKFVQEEEFTVISITPSKTKNRAIASFEVADKTGTPVGSVGTGFDQETAAQILQKHEENPNTLKVLVRFQGFTEKKSLWHPRFLAII